MSPCKKPEKRCASCTALMMADSPHDWCYNCRPDGLAVSIRKQYRSKPCQPCKHCGRLMYLAAVGLCTTCYRKPSVRKKYPSAAVPPQVPDRTGSRPPPAAPTTALAGTPAKIDALAARALAGCDLWHPDDAEGAPASVLDLAINEGRDLAGLKWTAAEDTLIRQHYPDGGSRWLAQQLGRPAKGIQARARRLGISGRSSRTALESEGVGG